MSQAKGDTKGDTKGDPARIGALLTGRTAPRERVARALATHLAPLAKADLSTLLGDGAATVVEPGDAGETSGGRWARLGSEDGATFIHVPDDAAAAMGTAMLGGATDGEPGEPTPVDWHLCALVVDALGGALPRPLRHIDWCGDAPEETDRATGLVGVAVQGAVHYLAIRVPIAALPLRAEPAAEATVSPAKGDPRRDATIRASATLDMAPIDLGHALSVAVGDVLPLDGQLGAITLRADGRAVLTGALGHAGGRLCLRVAERVSERAVEPDFEIARIAMSPTTRTQGEPQRPDTRRPDTMTTERRSAM